MSEPPSQILNASLDHPRRCMGRWVNGSGGHIVWSHDCSAPVEWVDAEGGDAFCDQHLPRVGGEIHPTFRGHVRRVEKAELDQQGVDLDELTRLEQAATPGPWYATQDGTHLCPYDVVWAKTDGEFLHAQVFKVDSGTRADCELTAALRNAAPKLLALARRALAQEATFTVNSSLPVETAFQLTLGELVEWSAGKVNADIVMTLLVALAGAVGRGAGVTMDDSGLRAAFDHGFNTEVRDKERS